MQHLVELAPTQSVKSMHDDKWIKSNWQLLHPLSLKFMAGWK